MRNLALAWLHGLAIFLAAMLLFSAQPMVGKLVLPLLGGTPGVWNTCMVFYQAALLAGYAYAHGGSGRLSFEMQCLLHALVLGLASCLLPIALPAGLEPPAAGGLAPPLWLFGVLAAAAGLPMVCLSATAPMLQRWFSLSGHPRARDPYFLYAASNAGSLAGLLAYPWIIEPWLSLPHQLQAWTFGFWTLLVLVLLSGGVDVWAQGVTMLGDAPRFREEHAARSSWRDLARWSALAAIPSSWLLGVTTYITTDLAAIPMLWTIPLALYLATYIIAFGKAAERATSLAVALLPLVAVPLVMILAAGFVHLFWMPLHLLAFFLGALLCHGRLAAARPPADRATAFYLAIAAGGVLGGLFNALVAPIVFDRLVEYPLAIVLGCLASPGLGTRKAERSSRSRDLGPVLDVALPLAVAGLTALLVTGPSGLVDTVPGMLGVTLAAGLGVYACITGLRRPRRFAMTAAGVLLASGLAREPGGTVLLRSRDFFGTLRVLDDRAAGAHRLLQGSTLHGQQSLDPALRGEPTAYFARTGPIGDVFAAVASSSRRTGIVGLGAGTLTCYARPDESWTFHEIDPAVPIIAENAEYFTYLSDARSRGASIDVVPGDARLRIREAAEASYRVLVLDAFSSDAVPVHLLTREAIRLYLTKLEPHGLLVFNISNRYLDLDPLMAIQAADAGLACRIRYDVQVDDAERRAGKQPSIWAVMARSEADLGLIAADDRWRSPTPRPGARPWTDDRSDLASYLVLGGRRLGRGQVAPMTSSRP